MTIRKSRWFVLGVLILVALGLWRGCASQERPEALSAAEEERLANSQPIAARVAIEPFNPPIYAKKLRDGLLAIRVFSEVGFKDEIPSPTHIAKVTRPIYGNAVIPILTAVSLGFIPTITTESHGYSFTLAPVNNPEKIVTIEFVHRGKTVLGWVAGVLNLFPGWTGGSVYEDSRFRNRFRLTILEKEAEIVSF